MQIPGPQSGPVEGWHNSPTLLAAGKDFFVGDVSRLVGFRGPQAHSCMASSWAPGSLCFKRVFYEVNECMCKLERGYMRGPVNE